MKRVHLVAGVLHRGERILLVASHYPNHPEPLWNLPGGRQREGELLDDAMRRECAEEAGLEVSVGTLAYVAESYDRATATHFLCTAFAIAAHGEPAVSGRDAHVVDCRWATRAEVAALVRVRVVREPLLAHLDGAGRRYFGFADAGITIEFADPA